MAELIQFYVPGNFRARMQQIPAGERGRIIEFRLPQDDAAARLSGGTNDVRVEPERFAAIDLCGF